MEQKVLLGIVSSIIGILSYIPYFIDIYRGKTRPDTFSWFTWSLITGIGFFAMIEKGADSGAWITGVSSLACFSIGVISLKMNRNFIIKTSDRICFFGALASIILWQTTNNPFLAICMVTITDLFGFIPTFIKSFKNPFEETPSAYMLNGFGFGISLLAISSINISTIIYPAYLFLANIICATIIYQRRNELK